MERKQEIAQTLKDEIAFLSKQIAIYTIDGYTYGLFANRIVAIREAIGKLESEEEMPKRMMVGELERLYNAAMVELAEVEQILGKALDYPLYADDPENFPDATEEDGVCVGEMTPAALAEQIAKEYALQNKQNTSFLVQALTKGTEASSLVSSLEQEKKNYDNLAELFDAQTKAFSSTKELLQLREKAVAKHEAISHIWENEVILGRAQERWLRTASDLKDKHIEKLEVQLSQLLDLTTRLNRMIYEVDDLALPKPDWTDVPSKFIWWAVDADGEVMYWSIKPEVDEKCTMWSSAEIMESNIEYDDVTWQPDDKPISIEIPLGIDWRMLIRRRP